MALRSSALPEPVGADTIFPTGSTGKAFTVADLAILVDQGKIDWDNKVIDGLPGFQMYDPWVTREMTIRDLLVHRSGLGLGAGDLLFVPRSNLSRAETVKRLRYIKPATSFRSDFAYDNILYMVAGQLIESVTGETWETFTADHLLKPGGMLHSTSDDETRFRVKDRAQPHARMNSGLRGAGDQEVLNERDDLGRNAAPAGGLAVSANDMARWLLIQLAHGKLPEGTGRLFSEAAHDQMWKPVVPLPIFSVPDALKLTQPMSLGLCARLGRAGLPRRQDHFAWRRGVRFSDGRRSHPREKCRLFDRNQFRGRRDHRRADVRTSRSLSWLFFFFFFF